MAEIFVATSDFFQSLDTIEQVANTLITPSALSPSALPITNSISCASIVLLSGYFESYLKSLIQEYIEKVNSLQMPSSKLPFSMKVLHYAGGATALEWAAKRDKDLLTLEMSKDLTNRLASLNLPVGYRLAWESFANTQSNPGPDTVKKLLSGVEVKGGWAVIGSLCTAHGSLENFLSSFMKIRNVCAHTGRHSTPPSGADLLDYIAKFRVLAECIELMLEVRYEEFAAL